MRKLFDKLFKKSETELFNELTSRMKEDKLTMIITANPESFMKSQSDEVISDAMLDECTIVTPDGEGIVKAAKMLSYELWGKIAGVDTVAYLLKELNEQHKSLYIYGSAQSVLDNFENVLKRDYPNIKIAGLKNGYDNDSEVVFKDMVEQSSDVVLVALGVPRQEKLIYEHLNDFNKGIFVGVGGSIDVLSGTKKRAPKLFIKLKLEWVYRLAKEPKRIKRFYDSNVKFIFNIKKMAKRGE
ncbi:MAG: WecB/TagA/CpsF family glycosyltransferase [Erysipelotrichaceae bacterium]